MPSRTEATSAIQRDIIYGIFAGLDRESYIKMEQNHSQGLPYTEFEFRYLICDRIPEEKLPETVEFLRENFPELYAKVEKVSYAPCETGKPIDYSDRELVERFL